MLLERSSSALSTGSCPTPSSPSAAAELAGRLARGPRSIGLTKRALDVSHENDLEAQLAVEERLQTEATTTNDFVEGVSAFLEKRRAKFTGS